MSSPRQPALRTTTPSAGGKPSPNTHSSTDMADHLKSMASRSSSRFSKQKSARSAAGRSPSSGNVQSPVQNTRSPRLRSPTFSEPSPRDKDRDANRERDGGRDSPTAASPESQQGLGPLETDWNRQVMDAFSTVEKRLIEAAKDETTDALDWESCTRREMRLCKMKVTNILEVIERRVQNMKSSYISQFQNLTLRTKTFRDEVQQKMKALTGTVHALKAAVAERDAEIRDLKEVVQMGRENGETGEVSILRKELQKRAETLQVLEDELRISEADRESLNEQLQTYRERRRSGVGLRERDRIKEAGRERTDSVLSADVQGLREELDEIKRQLDIHGSPGSGSRRTSTVVNESETQTSPPKHRIIFDAAPKPPPQLPPRSRTSDTESPANPTNSADPSISSLSKPSDGVDPETLATAGESGGDANVVISVTASSSPGGVKQLLQADDGGVEPIHEREMSQSSSYESDTMTDPSVTTNPSTSNLSSSARNLQPSVPSASGERTEDDIDDDDDDEEDGNVEREREIVEDSNAGAKPLTRPGRGSLALHVDAQDVSTPTSDIQMLTPSRPPNSSESGYESPDEASSTPQPTSSLSPSVSVDSSQRSRGGSVVDLRAIMKLPKEERRKQLRERAQKRLMERDASS